MRLRRSVALKLKRAMDIVGALTALILLSPVIAGVAISILVTQGRPLLFRQERPGLHGRPFTILKFRSMRPPGPGEVEYLTDEERVTRLGSFLRSTSLDELPEFFNVLRGDMSLVGPRPLFSRYLDHYTELELKRHGMRPGMTGWAVVNGRNKLQFKERVRLDLWYVDHWSVRLDLRILALTVKQVLNRTDVAVTEDDLRLGFPAPGSPIPAGALDDDQPGETTGAAREAAGDPVGDPPPGQPNEVPEPRAQRKGQRP